MIVDNIQALCVQKKITIRALEMEVGLGNGVIGKWRTVSPRIENLKRVADYFGCTVDDLLRDTDKTGA